MAHHDRVISISGLAKATKVTAPTIRFYEEIGLLPLAERSLSGQRRYTAKDVDRLNFIRRCRDFGFSIEKTRTLVGLSISAEGPCEDARAITADHLMDVRARIADLLAFEATLQGFVDQCDSICRGGSGRDCVVFSAIRLPPDEANLGKLEIPKLLSR